ncbi:hypothetical protein GcLGCM259_0808 [Glutamicibacter creatinolyticus]|uniref:Lipoprotein n=1 Tax=Glutamicibacter creatinolyticus TaxID=162496 RepID=A0A5B7WTG1_9MICC|nr:hypothetical protein [Glutamicibacter creatinolyticus]QCY46564.1 hypothetical protein GcLGCM259_0808 [Glutamicibacter creatinolyticus]
MQKRSMMILPLATAFVLAGCSGTVEYGSGVAPTASTTQSPAPVSSENSILSDEQAMKVVEQLLGDAEGAHILTTEELRAQSQAMKQQFDGVQIEPAKCRQVLTGSSLSDLGASTQVVGTSQTASSSRTYQVISLDDTKLDTVRQLLQPDSFDGCEQVTEHVKGQDIERQIKTLQTNLAADQASAFQLTTTGPQGSNTTAVAVSVQGLHGNEYVSVTDVVMSTHGGEEVDVQQVLSSLTKNANKAFAALESMR